MSSNPKIKIESSGPKHHRQSFILLLLIILITGAWLIMEQYTDIKHPTSHFITVPITSTEVDQWQKPITKEDVAVLQNMVAQEITRWHAVPDSDKTPEQLIYLRTLSAKLNVLSVNLWKIRGKSR